MIAGEALIKLLEKYGVDTIFGIPGVHTLDLYRGLLTSDIRHISVRHEQGAGFAADGYARVTGKPGVCLLISGPGVLNAMTPIGQAYSDSLPMLIISSDNPTSSLGKGYGLLHEVTDLTAVTAPVTGFSVTIAHPDELPKVVAKAFELFDSERPRPVHISIPTDVLAMDAGETEWSVGIKAKSPLPDPDLVSEAAQLLVEAKNPLILIGGGAKHAGEPLTQLTEYLPATAVTTNNGKGTVADHHPLSLWGSVSRPATHRAIENADVVLAIGTELSETDNYSDRYRFTGKVIRVDIDSDQFRRLYQTDIGIRADAKRTAEALLTAVQQIQPQPGDIEPLANELDDIRFAIQKEVTAAESRHIAVLDAIQAVIPGDAISVGDMTLIGYTATAFWHAGEPNRWLHAAGFCTLGCSVPMAIGAKIAAAEQPVLAMVGDAGFQFTLPELGTAVEQKLALPIVIWNNDGLGAIRGHMDEQGIEQIAVDYDSGNPDWVGLAEAYGCKGVRPQTIAELKQAIQDGLAMDRPYLIDVAEEIAWENLAE